MSSSRPVTTGIRGWVRCGTSSASVMGMGQEANAASPSSQRPPDADPREAGLAFALRTVSSGKSYSFNPNVRSIP
ncbi:hypothetical protein [Pelomicrobium methylotrophicum]|uniref:Uncharacterized protein n=1 Tax=Pelomicrobium methylotrophicum TaxID=2602750 RepID=A0A5C7EI26_9PROT|nr:hypothetical protein [Pelomicrobium methylotrophicum]TXF10498.1 hypothetical protein FR698_14850 [Pelomicrobium methylotrophicum]